MPADVREVCLDEGSRERIWVVGAAFPEVGKVGERLRDAREAE